MVRPLIEKLPGKFWSIVDADGFGNAALGDSLIENVNDIERSEFHSRLDRKRLATETVHEGQNPEWSLVEETF